MVYIEKQSIYNTIGKYNEAIECYHMANKFNFKSENLFFIASIYQKSLDEKQRALDYYNQFLESLPFKPESEYIPKGNEMTVTLKLIAERNIEKLKEELFFEDRLQD